MTIGILYESVEWSNRHLGDLLNQAGVKTELINLQTEPIDLSGILQHKLMVNRLFPSAPWRGYQKAFQLAGQILKEISDHKITLINSYEAYAFDCSKKAAGEALRRAGIPVPACYAYFSDPQKLPVDTLVFPCVLKPDCGGRSLHTTILHNQTELEQALKEIPQAPFIIQGYVEPVQHYTTRIEIVGSGVMSLTKRTIGERGISGYHSGSVYESYPNCPDRIVQLSFQALRTLKIEMGSLDIIESGADEFWIIDVNATTNFSPDNVEMLGFDPIWIMAEYILYRYQNLPL